jgi:23S rRNA pseudouridine2605 synthase
LKKKFSRKGQKSEGGSSYGKRTSTRSKSDSIGRTRKDKGGSYEKKRSSGFSEHGGFVKNNSDGGESDGGYKKRAYKSDGDFSKKRSSRSDNDKGFGKRSSRGGDDFKKKSFRSDSDGGYKKRGFKSDGDFSKKRSKRSDDDKGFGKRSSRDGDDFKKKSFRSDSEDGGYKKRAYKSDGDFSRKRSSRSDEDKGFGKRSSRGGDDFKKKSYGSDSGGGYKKRSYKSDGDFSKKSSRRSDDDKGFGKRTSRGGDDFKKKSYRSDSDGGYKKRGFKSDDRKGSFRKFGDKPGGQEGFVKKGNASESFHYDDIEEVKPKKERVIDVEKNKGRQIEKEGTFEHQEEKLNLFGKSETIRLNKYIANAGICARREADEHIAAGEVTVNGEVITAMGYRVKPGEVVTYQGKVVEPGRKVYILLNKPKDFVTTTDDERGRRTVMELLKGVTEERIYPVGRLDRNTTGLLLLTNDGELAQKLTHPSFEVRKVYHVVLNKNISREELDQIKDGVDLEDGIAEVDDADYAGTGLKNEVGIELHSGKNRIVRRIFEHLGFEVMGLDRVLYAGLTKKEIPRGHWRYLSDKEVVKLKHFTQKKPKPRSET